MSLRTRLVISFTVLLLAVIAAVGLVATRSVESILLGQVDSTWSGSPSAGRRSALFPSPGPDPGPARRSRSCGRSPSYWLTGTGMCSLPVPQGLATIPTLFQMSATFQTRPSRSIFPPSTTAWTIEW